jgi:hypothetical protein
MKPLSSLCLLLFSALPVLAQTNSTLDGAWQRIADSTTTSWIISDGYFMKVSYTTVGNRFINASGGILKQLTTSIETEMEFNSANKDDVGSFHLYDFTLTGNQLTLKHHDEVQKWSRIDDSKPGQLFGAWLFSGRKTKPDDEIQPYTPGIRKTMKIMSGTRFQWAAYNTETKEFLGTGGGTYTTVNGKYTENIGVFSRDNNRVGASLSFEMEIKEPHWNHSGKSSKGDPIYERWSKRKSFAGQ